MFPQITKIVFWLSLIACDCVFCELGGETRQIQIQDYFHDTHGDYDELYETDREFLKLKGPIAQDYGYPPGYPGSGPGIPQFGQQPFDYNINPGISPQAGFSGFMTPNSWYGMLPWGIEGSVVVIVGIIVFVIIVIALLALLAWFSGFGDYSIINARNLLPENVRYENIAQLTNNVLEALNKYDI